MHYESAYLTETASGRRTDVRGLLPAGAVSGRGAGLKCGGHGAHRHAVFDPDAYSLQECSFMEAEPTVHCF